MKINPDNICRLCGKEFKRLGMHLKQYHGVYDFKKYYDKYILVENEGKCLICGTECNFLGVMYGYHNYCSTTCSNNSVDVQQKKKDTCRENFGVDHPSQSDIVLNRQKQTMLEHHGVEHALQSKEIQTAYKQTCINRFNVDHPMKVKRISQQSLQTCISRHGGSGTGSKEINQKIIDSVCVIYGVSNIFFKTEYIREKFRLKYGVDFPHQVDEIKNKAQNTIKCRWGDLSNDIISQKRKNTCQEKYGTDSYTQTEEMKDKSKKTCLDRYGSDHFSKTFYGRKLCRENFISMVENQKLHGEPLTPRIGLLERECLNEIQNLSGYEIKRNNQIIGYFPDGYIELLNLVIEFDESWHNYSFQKNKDSQKDLDYRLINLNIFRITEKDWKENKEETIHNFLCVIRGLEDIKRLQDTL